MPPTIARSIYSFLSFVSRARLLSHGRPWCAGSRLFSWFPRTSWLPRVSATRRASVMWRLGAIALAGATCGCAPKPAGPETFPVSGIVTLDGTPVAGADLTFYPVSKDVATGGGHARTGDDGSYEASIYVDGGKSTKPGLPAGEYSVVISKLEQVAGPASLSKPPRNVLPAKYDAANSSGLKATVKSEDENPNDFRLVK